MVFMPWRLGLVSAFAILMLASSSNQETQQHRQRSRSNSDFDFNCDAETQDYPIGIYLGPQRLTSAYYNAENEPVTVANVHADPDWEALVLKRMLGGPHICWDWLPEERDEEGGPCNAILPGFLASMRTVIEATSVHLQRHIADVQIGFVVVPHYLRDYREIIDRVMHIAFNFTHHTEPHLSHDVVELGAGAQYGYDFVDSQSPWGSGRPPPNREGPKIPNFEENDYLLYVNIEDSFLELGFRCLTFWCWAPSTRKIVPNPGQETKLPAKAKADWQVRPPTSVQFGAVISSISRHIADFLDETEYTGEDGGVLRGVVLTGGASSDLALAAAHALQYAMPDTDPSLFLTFRDPAFVPSLGAALIGRNIVVDQLRSDLASFCGLVG